MVFCTGDETLGIMGTSVRVAVLGTASSNRSRSAAVTWPVVPYTFAAGSISRIVLLPVFAAGLLWTGFSVDNGSSLDQSLPVCGA